MYIVTYARVSTGPQAARELSIPAQLHAMKRYAHDHGLKIVENYTDVESAYKQNVVRPGLLDAIARVKKDPAVTGILVHKIDRLSRRTYQYNVYRALLRQHGAKVHSVVEHIDDSPAGQFTEDIMIANAEFASANMAHEVRKSLEQRLRKGLWNGPAPVGYLWENRRLVFDPARAMKVREAFELWSEGKLTSPELADAMYRKGLVSRYGNKIAATKWCRILQNPFYHGLMVTKVGVFPGSYPALVSKDLFTRAQQVFAVRGGGHGIKPRKHLFLLSGLVKCPRCAGNLVGSEHRKKSGKKYRYYRCHTKLCRFARKADELDQAVVDKLLEMKLPETVIRKLKKQLREQKRDRDKSSAERVAELRRQRRTLQERLRSLATEYAQGYVDEELYGMEHQGLREALRMVEWMESVGGDPDADDPKTPQLLQFAEGIDEMLRANDATKRREAVVAVARSVGLRRGGELEVALMPTWM